MITCPMGGHGSFHVDAEVATAGGTGAAGTLYVSSGASTRPMEDIAKATPGPKWFQIYMLKDMEVNRWLVQRAKAAGFSAIVLTADALGPGQTPQHRLGEGVRADAKATVLQSAAPSSRPARTNRGNNATATMNRSPSSRYASLKLAAAAARSTSGRTNSWVATSTGPIGTL